MTTLRELVDENYAGGSVIAVLSPVGEELGRIRPGEEEDSVALARLMGGQVIRAVRAQDAVYAYVSPPPEAPGARSQTPSVYQGPIADEAAWSADWRSRERKASDKQLSFIRRKDYDEYQIGFLEKGLIVSGVSMLFLIPSWFYLILGDPCYIVEYAMLVVVVHWTVVLAADLLFMLIRG